jgi:membrane-associated PAP2 superfamily phosphatase
MLDYYRSRDGRAFLQRQTLVLVGAAVTLCALFGDGRFDLAIARWFFDDARQLFPLANHWLLKNVLHDAARTASAAAALALLGMAAAVCATPPATRLHAYRQELMFAAVASFAAAAIVGALKHFSAHACPWDLVSFGGAAPYHPLLSAPGGAPSVHGCFPAAHPLSGYAWLAAGFSVYPLAPRLARLWWNIAFALGTLFGAVQIARGAHFPSHVLWSAWVVWAVNVALLAACVWLSTRARCVSATPNIALAAPRETLRPRPPVTTRESPASRPACTCRRRP